jgi:hypothetical protein
MATSTQSCQGCGAAIAGTDVLYTPDARVVCASCFAKLDVATTQRSSGLGFAGSGLVVGLVPFLASISESSYTTANGVVTHAVYRDWIAIACGAVAVGLGIVALALAVRARRSLVIAGTVAIALLGGLQIARGVGVFWSPPVEPREPSASVPPPASDDPSSCADARTCFDLGARFHDAHDDAQALAAYRRACELGSPGRLVVASATIAARDSL